MGYFDGMLQLSASQAVTADAISSYTIDSEVTTPTWLNKTSVFIEVETKTVAGTGIGFDVVQKTTAPTTGGDATIVKAIVLAADLAAGNIIEIPLPRGITFLRHIGLYYDITGGTESYVLSAFLGPST